MATSDLAGILALQGDYFAHGRVLQKLGRRFIYVRTAEDLKHVDSLIIPGGESTTMRKLAKEDGLWDELKKFDRPILGTCAGIILLAKEIINPSEEGLGLLDVTIERNAYGSQIDSFVAVGQLIPQNKYVDLVFIRAPKISRTGAGVEIIAKHRDETVGVKQGKLIGLTFHPELTSDTSIIRLYLSIIENAPKTP